ncbi:MAG: DUF4190 domain-containing protein [Planctomycetes bacterium]|nr:DUF4190 domain-containing protein [Planctomycetota bacterium]
MSQVPPHSRPAHAHMNPQPGQGLAIAALVIGICSLCIPLLSVVAITLGIIALVGTTGPVPKHGGRGLAVGGLVLGVVSLLLIPALMVGLMLPALGRARQAARTVKSQSQMRILAQSLTMYADTGNGSLPTYDNWDSVLVWNNYISPEILTSPVAPGPISIATYFDYEAAGPPAGHVVNPPSYFFVPASTITTDSTRVLLYEHPDHYNDLGLIAYHDGHVSRLPRNEFDLIISSLTLEDGTRWAPHEEFPLNDQ